MKTPLFILLVLLYCHPTAWSQHLIVSGDVWKFLDTGVAPSSTNWTGNGTFDDATWRQGPSQLGYGNDGERTLVSYGPSATSKYITTYFRRAISLTDASGTFSLRYKRDDGIVIYINGTELLREYLPTGTLTNTTLASTIPDTEEPLWKTVSVPASLLRAGANVIAAEIHQASLTSSDIRFDLELTKNTPTTITLERGPYLQRYSDDPSLAITPGKRSMTIRWSTSAAADGRVIYKTPTGNPVTSPLQSSTALAFEAGTPVAQTIHNVSVTLNNLEPDMVYSYTIQSGTLSQGDATYYFKTAPVTGSTKKTRMWVLGDFGKKPDANGNPNADQIKVRDSFNAYVQANATNEADKYVDLWLWLGDNAYDWGRDWEYQQSVFNVYDSRKSPSQWIMKQTPFFATPGNHEYRNNQDPGAVARTNHGMNHYYSVVNNMTAGDAVGEHSRKEEYYSFDHANIHFVSLDTYGYEPNQTTVFPANSTQLAWLNRDLALAQASTKIKWIVVFFHHPPYTITEGSHNSDTEQELIDLRERLLKNVLEKYRVDLVLTGHSHNYQRSWPIQGHYGLEQEFTASMDTYRVPVAASMSADGRYDCVTYAPNSTSLTSAGKSLIYHKSSTATKNHIIYVVNGSGGGIEGNAGSKWPHDAMQSFAYEAGSMYLEVEGNRLDGKFINADGVVRDQFKIIKDADTFTIPVTDGTTRKPDCECPDAAGYTHYVERPSTGAANLLLSLKKNGNAIGTVGDGMFDLQLKGKAGSATYIDYAQPNDYVKASMYVQNRHWVLKATQELAPTATVSVRHYWNKADYNGFTNIYYGAWQLNYDYMFETININDDDGQTVRYERDPTVDQHRTIPKATDYKANGAWIYKNGQTPSATNYTFGFPNASFDKFQYSEFVVGRLRRIGGTIGGLLSPYTSGNRMAANEANSQSEYSLSAYPNPTVDGKVFFSPALSYQSYLLTDMQGKILKQDHAAGSLDQLDLSDLSPGVYFLVSQGQYGTSRIKLVRH